MSIGRPQSYGRIQHKLYVGEVTSNVNYAINIMKENNKSKNTLIIAHTLSIAEQLQVIYAHDQLDPQNIIDSEMFADNMITEDITNVILILGDVQLKILNVTTYLIVYKKLELTVIAPQSIYNKYAFLQTQFVTVRCQRSTKPLEINKYYLVDVQTFSDEENDCIRLTMLTHLLLGRIGHADAQSKLCKQIIIAPGRLQKAIGRLLSDLCKRFVVVSEKGNSMQKVANTMQFIKQKEIHFLVISDVNYALTYLLANKNGPRSKSPNHAPKIRIQWIICGLQYISESLSQFMALSNSDIIWLSSGAYERLNIESLSQTPQSAKQIILLDYGFKNYPIIIPSVVQKLTETALEPVIRDVMAAAHGSYVGGATRSVKWEQLLLNERIQKYLGPKVPEATFYLLNAQKGKLERFCLITDQRARKFIISGLENEDFQCFSKKKQRRSNVQRQTRYQNYVNYRTCASNEYQKESINSFAQQSYKKVYDENDNIYQSRPKNKNSNNKNHNRPRWHDLTQHEAGWEFSRRAIATAVCAQLLNAGNIYYVAPASLLPNWPPGSIWTMALSDDENDIEGFAKLVDDIAYQAKLGSIVIFGLSDPRRSEELSDESLSEKEYKHKNRMSPDSQNTSTSFKCSQTSQLHNNFASQTADYEEENSQSDNCEYIDDLDETGRQLVERTLYVMNADVHWAEGVFVIVFS